MLEQAGLSEKDVQIVEMSPPEMPSALSVGQIAGYSVAEPFGSLALEMGTGKVFEDPDHLWHDNICCALVFNGQFVDEHHDLAKSFHKSLSRCRYIFRRASKGTRGDFLQST